MILIPQIATALVIGVFYYMVAVALFVYDEPLSIIFQPIIGLIITGLAIGPCLVAGLPIRLSKKINETWKKKWWISFVIGSLGFVLMAMSVMKGNQIEVYDSYLKQNVMTLNSRLSISGFLITIFAVIHFYPPWIQEANKSE